MNKLSRLAVKGFTLLTADYHSSVVRRTLLFLVLIVPAFLANFLVYYFGTRLLPADQFGVFYVANTVSNVIFSAALIFNVFFSRLLVRVRQDSTELAAMQALRRLERAVVPIGGCVAVSAAIILVLIGGHLGISSRWIVILVVLDAYVAYIADLGRTLLQSLNRTVSLGLYTLVMMVARFALCMVGILTFHTVAGAFTGIVLSELLVYLTFRFWLSRQLARGGPARVGQPQPLPSIMAILPVVIGYGLMTVMTNLDVLLSYFALKEADLGIYSASSVFPKAILVVMTPVSQMLFPMMFRGDAEPRDFVATAAKICVTVLFAAVGAAAVVWLLSGFLCGGRLGLQLCSVTPLSTLLVAVIPLALLRVAVLFQLARGRDALLLSLALPIVVYGYIALRMPLGVDTLASSFALFSYAGLTFFAILSSARELMVRWHRTVPSTSLRDH